jgi:hypothetical protein
MRLHAVKDAQTERFQFGIAQAIVNKSQLHGTLDRRIRIELEEQLKGHFSSARSAGHAAGLNFKPGACNFVCRRYDSG